VPDGQPGREHGRHHRQQQDQHGDPATPRAEHHPPVARPPHPSTPGAGAARPGHAPSPGADATASAAPATRPELGGVLGEQAGAGVGEHRHPEPQPAAAAGLDRVAVVVAEGLHHLLAERPPMGRRVEPHEQPVRPLRPPPSPPAMTVHADASRSRSRATATTRA
jgi:hypothetical protein